jgi:hypothetical protein
MLSKYQGTVQLEELGKLIKIIHLDGSGTHDLLACSFALFFFKMITLENPGMSFWLLII